ncbi:MAG: TonB family protein [Thermoanaerobaculia bacterium]
MSSSDLPRPFGDYLLTALLGHDALGRVYRALRVSGEKSFVRLRILESPELSEDAVLDAIQEYGEIHAFLKNPAIARGVQMDAVEGTPFIAWNEESGRTLDALLEKGRTTGQRVPPEHALLIAEKVASALDHAYNTTVDGERSVHGLVWPGFVCISDDGETRLTGFGLAAGVLPALDRPRLSEEIAPYAAPEVRASKKPGRNSDVYSVGVLLFEMLAGVLPSGADPAGDLGTLAQEDGGALTPEVIALLRSALAPAGTRYQSPVELRRELGKLLFAGPYAPSTFNLAFFLNHAFGSEIEAETSARESELRGEPRPAGRSGAPPAPPPKAPVPAAPRERAVAPAPGPATPPARQTGKDGPARRPVAVVVAALLVAAVAGAVYVLSRAPERPPAVPLARPALVETPAFTPTAPPTPESVAPTVEMTDAQFQDEVSRRVAQEIRKLEEALQKKEEEKARAAAPTAEAVASDSPGAPSAEEATPSPPPSADASAEPGASPSPEPPGAETRGVPVAAAPAGGEPAGAPGAEEVVSPPRIKRVVKPTYPPIALRQRIGGIVILRVLVSETGQPREVEVLRGVRGGLSEAAAAAVRRWTFEPATRRGEPVSAWTTVPIPFEP